MKRALLLFPLLLTTLVAACEYFESQSHVHHGELYRCGQVRYDDYFAKVHDVQVAAADVEDAVRASKRPLVVALKLTMDSTSDTIVQDTHDRVNAAVGAFGGGASLDVQGLSVHFLTQNAQRGEADTQALLAALEKTARAELALAQKLGDVPAVVDALRATGKDLEQHTREDFGSSGAQKVAEVRQEFASSFDVLDDAEYGAKRQIKASSDLVARLQRACAIGSPPSSGSYPAEPSPPPPPPPPPTSSASASATSDARAAQSPAPTHTAPVPVAAQRPAPYVAPHPASPPPAAPPPAPTSTGEVFNP